MFSVNLESMKIASLKEKRAMKSFDAFIKLARESPARLIDLVNTETAKPPKYHQDAAGFYFIGMIQGVCLCLAYDATTAMKVLELVVADDLKNYKPEDFIGPKRKWSRRGK
jgi:hypothetical protein